MHAKLIIVGGRANRTEIRLKLPMIVGRGRKSGIVIAHPTVSRQHCELYEEDGKVVVRDLGSLNGTLVADEQVQRGCLEHGALLSIGPLTFQVVYEHLGAVPAPATPAAADDVHAEPPIPAPELSPTIVDMPRVGSGERLDATIPLDAVAEVPLVDISPELDEALDRSLPAHGESDNAALGLVETQDLLSDAEDDLGFELESTATNAALQENADEAVSELDTTEGSAEDMGFDLAPAPPQEDATVDLVSAREETQSSTPQPPLAVDVAQDGDDFMSLMVEETIVNDVELKTPAERAPADQADEAEPTDSVSTAAADAELDWLEDTMVEATPDVAEEPDLDDGIPPDALAPVTVLMDEDVAEELAFDEPEVGESRPAPAAVEPAPQPKAKKKRGLWPFGRKKKAEAAIKEIIETQVESPAPAAIELPAELETPTVSEPAVRERVSAKTVVMDDLELEEVSDVAPSAVTMVDISLTRELAHEKTVAIDDSIALTQDAEPEDLIADAPKSKRKRGLFQLGGKKRAGAVAPASSQGVDPVALTEAADKSIAASATSGELDQPAKKRGWWPFRKRKQGMAIAEPVAPDSPEAKTAAAPIADVTAPSPESFEFSEAELLEITAEVAPLTPPAADNPQALAADEVLDFDLDLPLEHVSASIQPVLSDEPPPTSGADDDDFLDFLAEELPSAKPKPNG